MSHEPISLVLPPEMTIYQVGGLRDAWLATLSECARSGQALQVDSQHVTELDGAGLQLLCALRHSVQSAGLDFRLEPEDSKLVQALDQLGIRQGWDLP